MNNNAIIIIIIIMQLYFEPKFNTLIVSSDTYVRLMTGLFRDSKPLEGSPVITILNVSTLNLI